jgi:hypothetical protein
VTTTIRFAELPSGVKVEVWNEDGDTVIIVNSTLPRRERNAAARAAMRAANALRNRGLLLPLPVLLAAGRVRQWMADHPARAAVTCAAAVGLAAALTLSVVTDRGRSLPQAGPRRTAPAVTVHATPTAHPTRAPGRTPPATARPGRPPDGATRRPRRNKSPAPPTVSTPRPTRRPQASPAPPEPPEPTPTEPTPPPQPTSLPPPPAPTVTNPQPVSEPTAQTAGCDDINVRVKADPLADVDACLLSR